MECLCSLSPSSETSILLFLWITLDGLLLNFLSNSFFFVLFSVTEELSKEKILVICV